MIELGPNHYGKSAIRVVKVVRGPDGHQIRDLTVAISLEGDFEAAHVSDDNSLVVATDTMKNTTYALARDHLTGPVEHFARVLAEHFGAFEQVGRASVSISEHAWTPVPTNAGAARDAFVRTDELTRTTVVQAEGNRLTIQAGFDDLTLMKTAHSSFSGFPRDEYTTLAETDDRLLASKISATWRYASAAVDFDAAFDGVCATLLDVFAQHHSASVQATIWTIGEAVLLARPEIAEIQLKMPNLHHWLVDLAPFGQVNDREVYTPTSEPFGLIEATIRRGEVEPAPVDDADSGAFAALVGEPKAEAQPEPEPAAVAVAGSAPEPVAAREPEPATASEPEVEVGPEPAFEVEPAAAEPQPGLEPAPEPAADATPEPEAAPGTEPASAPEPIIIGAAVAPAGAASVEPIIIGASVAPAASAPAAAAEPVIIGAPAPAPAPEPVIIGAPAPATAPAPASAPAAVAPEPEPEAAAPVIAEAAAVAAAAGAPPPPVVLPAGVEMRGPAVAGLDSILTSEALAFLAGLQRQFGARRLELLAARKKRQSVLDRGILPDFLADTADVRAGTWTVARAPADLVDRRVEITGPAEPKMMINALNSGARVFMADLEDSLSPTWANLIGGQAAIADAVRRRLEFTSPEGKQYQLNERIATLVVRPRGWQLDERHLLVDGAPVSASLFDFGLFVFHNAREQLSRGTAPYVYLPKLESHLEARLWNDVFKAAQESLGIPVGTIRATVLIETILAAFEMDEILYELREHAAGLNAGRWDYLFSCIKKFRAQSHLVLPDRAQLTMTVPFMRAYTQLLVQTCHRRGAHAIGGMAAFIPSRKDPEVNAAAMAKVREDKERESSDGFDGTWVAHPDLVPLATEIFDGVLGAATDQRLRQRPPRSPFPLPSCSTLPSKVARSPRPGSGPTSPSRSSTSTRGCLATAPPRSTT